MRDGTPLPATLSGNTIERLIRIDEALIYLVNGALEWLCDKEPFEETGVLTIENAKLALSAMFWTYFTEEPPMIPIGQITPFGSATMPTKWIKCDGAAISRATYADLFAIIGTNYGVGNGTTTFNLPDLRSRSPYGVGAGTVTSLGQAAGAEAVGLTINQLPAHDHDYNDPGHFHDHIRAGGAAGGGYTNVVGATNTTPVNVAWPTQVKATGITFHAQGANALHPNLHPVLGVNFIIYAGV